MKYFGKIEDTKDLVTKEYVDGAIPEPWDGTYQGGSVPSIPDPASSAPAMDGTASAGTSTDYARADHVHPSDTSKQDKIMASGILKGNGNGGVSAATAGTDYGTYSKPSGGIPKTDLASAVQTSLGKADTALQAHQDISGKLDVNQGSGNAGKFLVVGSDGTVTPTAMSVWQGGSY